MDRLEPIFRFLRYFPALLWVSLVSFFQYFVPPSWYAKDVSEEVVLITGAGSGLGRDLALRYAELDASLVLWDINVSGLSETKEMVEQVYAKLTKKHDHEKFCLVYEVDVSDREVISKSAKQVKEDLERIEKSSKKYVSVLVNNAGIYHGLMLQELKDHQIERIFRINVLAHFWTVRAFLPDMIEHEHGHIVEIASMAGFAGLTKQVDYCATKFAIVGFEEALSVELYAMGLSDKIHTTAICPFFFQSKLFQGFDSKAAPLMTCEYVASQTIMAMRCNHSRVLLPPRAQFLNLIKPITPRRALFIWTKISNLLEGIREVKGAAATK